MSLEQIQMTSGPNLGVWREWRSRPGMRSLENGYSRDEPRLQWLGCPGPDGKDGQRPTRRAVALTKASAQTSAEPAEDGRMEALDRGYSAALNELSRAESDARSAKEDAAKAAENATRAANAAKQAAADAGQAAVDAMDVSERLDRHEQAAEQAMAELPAIADRLREIADMLRHGDAFVRKVGDFAPPERPASQNRP